MTPSFHSLPLKPTANSSAPSTSSRLADRAAHGLRLAIVAAIVICLYTDSRVARGPSEDTVQQLSLDEVLPFFPSANALGPPDNQLGTQIVKDAKGNELGYVLQTSPESDSIVGFAGSTRCLIAFDSDDLVLGVSILSSQDTQEHVEDIQQDTKFLASWNSKTWDEAGKLEVDAVSGATLTSYAISDAIRLKLGGFPPNLRFPQAPTIDQAIPYFASATQLAPSSVEQGIYDVLDDTGRRVGRMLRSSPAGDGVLGYQGPTEAFLAIDENDQILGMTIGASYDNEPYVGYLREDSYYLELLNGRSRQELGDAAFDPYDVEGVSGATMSSQAVIESVALAAQESLVQREPRKLEWPISSRDIGTITVLLLGLFFCFSKWKFKRKLRPWFLATLVIYYGFLNSDLISLALLTGWAQNGVPLRLATGLSLLTAAALLVPAVTKQQLYCHHLCPFGAAQQLIRARAKPRLRIPRLAARLLGGIPAVLLIIAMLSIVFQWPVSLAAFEPFDAFIFWVAGPVSIAIFIVGLIVSAFVPMGYCKFGCPTGSILDYVRFRSQSRRFRTADVAAITLLAIALVGRLFV